MGAPLGGPAPRRCSSTTCCCSPGSRCRPGRCSCSCAGGPAALAAGAVAGSLFAFNAHLMSRMPHMQALHVEFLPLLLWALDRVSYRGRRRDAVWLGPRRRAPGPDSNYLLVFVIVAMAVAVLVRAPGVAARGSGAHRRRAGACGGHHGRAGDAVPRPVLPGAAGAGPDALARRGGALRGHVARPSLHRGHLHYEAWSHRFADGATALFPGVAGLLLALLGLVLARGWRDARVRMVAAIGVAGVALSFGPSMPGYALLYQWMPLLQGLRGPARFGFLGLTAVAIARRLRRGRAAAALGRAPLVAGARRRTAARRPRGDLVRAGGLPGVRRHPAHLRVARRPPRSRPSPSSPSTAGGDLPQRDLHAELDRALEAAVNGYSGFMPRRFGRYAEVLARLPRRRVPRPAPRARRLARRRALRRLRRRRSAGTSRCACAGARG